MNQMLCGYRDNPNALIDPDDQFTDGPELSAPVWIKSEHYISAVERSAKVNADGLCRLWCRWGDSASSRRALRNFLHGFLMMTSLNTFDAAWREIDFLSDLLDAEILGDEQ